jgi:hypothetical protein
LPATLLRDRATATGLVAVRIIASDGSETLAPSGLVQLIDGRFVLSTPLSANTLGLSIDYQAGFGLTAASVPEAFKVSILEAVSNALIRRDNGNPDGGQLWDQRQSELKL